MNVIKYKLIKLYVALISIKEKLFGVEKMTACEWEKRRLRREQIKSGTNGTPSFYLRSKRPPAPPAAPTADYYLKEVLKSIAAKQREANKCKCEEQKD